MVKSFFLILLVVCLFYPAQALCLMSSTNYTIFADSVDSGGIFSSGGVYNLEDTIGETPIGFTTSSVYEVRAGYQAMDWSTISLDIDSSNLNLGTMDVALVKSASAIATVNTDWQNGYALSVSDISGTHLADVTGGAVVAGTEAYGLAVSGVDNLFTDDRAIIAGLNLSSSSTAVTSAQTTLTFKAAISAGTAAGDRSQSITLTAVTNF